MNFRFNVNLNDNDYLDYNTFWMLRSPYGKKQIKTIRIIVAVVFAVIVFISLFGGKFTVDSFLRIIPDFIVFFLVQIFLPKFFLWSLKAQMKSLKKSGKMGYSPKSVVEFSENGFIETAPDNKTEHKYSAIERVSIVDNKVIYIHVNNVMSYMLPISCFDSKEQYDDFVDFIKKKCTNIDIY